MKNLREMSQPFGHCVLKTSAALCVTKVTLRRQWRRVKNDEHKIKSRDDLISLPTRSLCSAIMKDAVATALLLDAC